jgi:hypothetical protein
MRKTTTQLRREAPDFFKANTFKELHEAYVIEDQKLFKNREWDPHNPNLIINEIAHLFMRINPEELDSSDREWWAETLWFWYHHAISYALWRRNKKLAHEYATYALRYQQDDHPNKITKLLWMLTRDDLTGAQKWAAQIPPELDRELAFELISDYEQGRLF